MAIFDCEWHSLTENVSIMTTRGHCIAFFMMYQFTLIILMLKNSLSKSWRSLLTTKPTFQFRVILLLRLGKLMNINNIPKETPCLINSDR